MRFLNLPLNFRYFPRFLKAHDGPPRLALQPPSRPVPGLGSLLHFIIYFYLYFFIILELRPRSLYRRLAQGLFVLLEWECFLEFKLQNLNHFNLMCRKSRRRFLQAFFFLIILVYIFSIFFLYRVVYLIVKDLCMYP